MQLNYVHFINRLHSNYVLYYNHSKGQESCDGRTGDEPGIPSKISQAPRRWWDCLVKAGDVPESTKPDTSGKYLDNGISAPL